MYKYLFALIYSLITKKKVWEEISTNIRERMYNGVVYIYMYVHSPIEDDKMSIYVTGAVVPDQIGRAHV